MQTFEQEVLTELETYKNLVAMGVEQTDAMEGFLSVLTQKMYAIRYDIRTKEVPMGPRNVHTEHCCAVHGCKYGHDDCPVEKRENRQSYPCESCRMDDGTW